MTLLDMSDVDAAKSSIEELTARKDRRIAQLEEVLLAIDHAIPVETIIKALVKENELSALDVYFNTIVETCAKQSTRYGGSGMQAAAIRSIKK